MSHIDRNVGSRSQVETQPIIHALIASFLALGSAVNEETLRRAGNNLRELICDPESRLSPIAIRILEDILVGIDHE
jgi:hypothetical protein